MKEVWKDIKNYEGYYQISNLGNVKSLVRKNRLTEIMLKPSKNHNGYYYLQLNKNGIGKNIFVHRLVAINFIENPHNKPTINHKDSIRTNNNVNNLEWATYSENNKHAYTNGFQKPQMLNKFGKNHIASKPILQYDINNNFIREYDCGYDAMRKLGILANSISNVCNGKNKTAGGYIWKFKNKKDETI